MTTELSVHMDCEGCHKKIRKALLKLDGVDGVDIDMVQQKVSVTGWANPMTIIKAVRKTGRTAVLWPYPYNADYYNGNYAQHYYPHHYQPSNGYHHHHHVSYPAHPYAYASTSSYNYRKHGYSDDYHGHYQSPVYSTVVDERTGAFFSDDNTSACSIM